MARNHSRSRDRRRGAGRHDAGGRARHDGPATGRAGAGDGTRSGADAQVLAAGGIVWRLGLVADPSGAVGKAVEVVLIHRPHQDDWTFPKGKLDPGESFEDAARREVEEETGLRCELGDELPSIRYADGKGRSKLVRYWAMEVRGGGPWAPNDEVDRRRWVTVPEAAELLTYPHDGELLASFAATHGPA
jgi:8-oxo-dGTP diphosphatase